MKRLFACVLKFGGVFQVFDASLSYNLRIIIRGIISGCVQLNLRKTAILRIDGFELLIFLLKLLIIVYNFRNVELSQQAVLLFGGSAGNAIKLIFFFAQMRVGLLFEDIFNGDSSVQKRGA